MAIYFITGANRGLGLEFVRQLRARGQEVIAAARSASGELSRLGARVVAMDVADESSIQRAAREIGGPVDVLINNAGVSSAAKRLGDLTARELAQVFAVNALGPVLVAKALLPALRAGEDKKVINISSQMGSIAHN